MKTIMFVALVAAAGCSKKGSDCDASIGKGIDNFAATIKASAPNPQIQENKLSMLGKLRGTLTQRCTNDKWSPEVVSCFATVATMKDMQACQGKLSSEQRTRLLDEVREIMMSTMGARMPSVRAGDELPGGAGSSGAAPAGASAAPVGSAAAPAGSAAAPAPAGSAAPPPAAGSNAQ
jgi:hypothetical protein